MAENTRKFTDEEQTKMPRMSWTRHVSNKDVLRKMGRKETIEI